MAVPGPICTVLWAINRTSMETVKGMGKLVVLKIAVDGTKKCKSTNVKRRDGKTLGNRPRLFGEFKIMIC